MLGSKLENDADSNNYILQVGVVERLALPLMRNVLALPKFAG